MPYYRFPPPPSTCHPPSSFLTPSPFPFPKKFKIKIKEKKAKASEKLYTFLPQHRHQPNYFFSFSISFQTNKPLHTSFVLRWPKRTLTSAALPLPPVTSQSTWTPTTLPFPPLLPVTPSSFVHFIHFSRSRVIT